MSIWNKAESLGGVASGVAAMVVAIFAIYQSSQAQSDLEDVMSLMTGMNTFFEEQEHRQSALSLIGAFRDNDWEDMTVDQLRKSQQAIALGVDSEDFASVLWAGYTAGYMNHIRVAGEGRSGEVYLIRWNPFLRVEN